MLGVEQEYYRYFADKKGAKSVDAIDINRNAFQSSKENIKINKCQNINLSNNNSRIFNWQLLRFNNFKYNPKHPYE